MDGGTAREFGLIQNMDGLELPPLPPAVWRRGSVQEVAWANNANHGGGYSYRLCPASSTLNEECFNHHPLTMVGQSKLRWGGVGGRELAYDAVNVTVGTKAGVMWRKVRGEYARRGPAHYTRLKGLALTRACGVIL